MADKLFDAIQYGGILTDPALPPYNDFSDAYANNKGTYITFQHEPSGKTVRFKAFITAFNETFKSDWTSQPVYGRADPIHMFKQTRRSISLSFVAPAASSGEAYENLGRIQSLAKFLYPTYVDVQGAQTISQSPLVRLRVMNLLSRNDGEKFPYGVTLHDPESPDSNLRASPITQYGEYLTSAGGSQGLLGIIQNVTFNHNLQGDHGVIDPAPGVIIPKLLEVNLSFDVIHEHPVGWNEEGGFGTALLPPESSIPDIDPDLLAASEGIEAAAAGVLEVTAAMDAAQDAASANWAAQLDGIVIPAAEAAEDGDSVDTSVGGVGGG